MSAYGPCPSCGGCKAELAAENPAHSVNTGARVFTSRIRNVLCRGCGLIYNDPMPTETELAELYVAMARDVSDRPAPATGRIMPIERDQADFVWQHVEGRGAPRVLDIGCSMGGFLAALRERGATTVGIEPSPHDAAVARDAFGLDVRPGFLEEIDFGAERFDLVSMRFVFEHVRDPRGIVRRARALLTDGGLLFIEVPNLAMPFVGFDDYFSYGHLQTFTRGTLQYLCGAEGLTPLVTEEHANVFASSPHPPSIRALLAWRGTPPEIVPDVDAARAHLERYLQARASLIARAAGQLRDLVSLGGRVVIYGAGTHTAELWRACPFLAGKTVAMVDGNPALQGHDFLGVPVRSPRELRPLRPDAIVISVRTAEAQIAGFLAAEGFADRTVRLYAEAGTAAA